MSESNEWEIAVTLRRRPGTRHKLGPIDQAEFTELWDQLVQLAYREGFTLTGLPSPKRTNCPHCGRIIRSPIAKRCPLCGINFETKEVKP